MVPSMSGGIERYRRPWLLWVLALVAGACDGPSPRGCEPSERVACETSGDNDLDLDTTTLPVPDASAITAFE